MSDRQTCPYEPNPEQNCTFCGTERWDGMWCGAGGEIFCCQQCATKILPALIADSIHHAASLKPNDTITEVTGHLWRALFLRLRRHTEQSNKNAAN